MVRDLVDDIIVVEDKEIIKAMKLYYEILKVPVKPSGALYRSCCSSVGQFQENSCLGEPQKHGNCTVRGNVDLGVLWNSLGK